MHTSASRATVTPSLRLTSLVPRLKDRPRTAVVAATAVVAVVVCFLRFGADVRGLLAAGFVAVLVVLAAIDLDEHRLPNRIVLPSAAIALVIQTVDSPQKAPEWILASLGAAAALLTLALAYPAGLGFGDVKLGLLLGAVLGASVVPALLIAFLSVFPVAVYLLARHGLSARRTAIPFGPFLAFGAVVVLFATVT